MHEIIHRAIANTRGWAIAFLLMALLLFAASAPVFAYADASSTDSRPGQDPPVPSNEMTSVTDKEWGKETDVDIFVGYGETVFWTKGNGSSMSSVAETALGDRGFSYYSDGNVVPAMPLEGFIATMASVFLWSDDRWVPTTFSLEELDLVDGDRIALIWNLSTGDNVATPETLTLEGHDFGGLYYEDTGRAYSFTDGPVYSGLTASWSESPSEESVEASVMWVAVFIAATVMITYYGYRRISSISAESVGNTYRRGPGLSMRLGAQSTDTFAFEGIPGETPVITPFTTERFPETLHCSKCDHLWLPKKDKHPKCCPKCHSRRWDEAPYVKRDCVVCGHAWTNREERCPICRTATWKEREVYRHFCNQCTTGWYSYSASPVRCPACQSTKWDDMSIDDSECLRCGHTWQSRGGHSKKCPSCGSYKWNQEPKQNTCTRCNRVWIQSGDKPKYCPFCRSKKWDEPIRSYTCPSCGFTRNLRSNSRPVCPMCGIDHGKFEF
jgi:hypothetical protein